MQQPTSPCSYLLVQVFRPNGTMPGTQFTVSTVENCVTNGNSSPLPLPTYNGFRCGPLHHPLSGGAVPLHTGLSLQVRPREHLQVSPTNRLYQIKSSVQYVARGRVDLAIAWNLHLLQVRTLTELI